MNTASPPPSSSRRPRSFATTLIVVALLVGYTLLQPRLEEWFGTELPSLAESPAVETNEPQAPSIDVRTTPEAEASRESSGPAREKPAAAASITAPPKRNQSPRSTQGRSQTFDKPTTASNLEKTSRLGELRDLGGKVFKSTAGLYYRPGSQEGHRINHILRHHEDDPDRPVHGVFDGDRNEVFAVIDEAYLYTFDHGPPRVTTEKEDGRTIYRVDLERRIGYVGGQSGKRQGHPPARHVQLILDGANVITAYPVRFGRQRD